MRTNLKGLVKHFSRNNWSGYWVLDGKPLKNTEAHKFVEMAIQSGYEYDDDVPDDLVSKWIGRPEIKSEANHEAR